MKLVIGGATGFVGTELLRQALENPAVTSIVGLSRRETKLPEGSSDASGKLKSVVCEDLASYPADLKKELGDVDACIWTIAITPSKMKETSWDEVVRVTRDYTLTALHTMTEVRPVGNQKAPLRFMYMSGHFAPRDRSHVVKQLADFGLAEVGLLRVRSQSSDSLSCQHNPIHSLKFAILPLYRVRSNHRSLTTRANRRIEW